MTIEMNLRNNVEAISSLKVLQECGLLNGHEIEVVNRLGGPDTPPDRANEMAETVRLRIKVADAHKLSSISSSMQGRVSIIKQ